jgi:hypothetical protein
LNPSKASKKDGRQSKQDLIAEVWRWGRVGAIALLLVIAFLLIIKKIDAEIAGAVVGVLVGAAVIAVLTPDVVRGLLDRMQKVSLGPFAMDLVSDAAKAAAQGDAVEDDSSKAESIVELQMAIGLKMAYVAKHLLTNNEGTTYATIGSLKFDGYLTDSEALTAMRVMTISDETLNALPQRPREEFLHNANTLAENFRAAVFAGMVRKVIRESPVEMVGQVDVGGGSRPDLLVSYGGKEFRIAVAFAPGAEGQDWVKRKKERLAAAGGPGATLERMVVVPDISNIAEDREGNPPLLHLGGLIEAIVQSVQP